MRTALFAVVTAGAVVAAGCWPGSGRPAANRLAVGDVAPPLSVQHWVGGDPVAAYEPGKVYVVDFWATWCPPCLASLPKLAALQADHAADGLVVVPIALQGADTPDAVDAFAAGPGAELKLRFGVTTTPDMGRTYFQAAGFTGIPSTVVIDRRGKVAYLGDPFEMEATGVVERVLAAK